MTDEQITDRMAQMIRVGFVNARQPEKMRVKVTVPDTTGAELVTDFLPVLCPRACEDMQYDLPDVGDQVLCLFLPYGLEQGFVIGAMYGKQAPPVQSGDKWHRKFKDGTWLEYDREQHKLVANVQGNVEITATGNVDAKVEGNVSTQSQGPTSVQSQAEVTVAAPSMNFGGVGGATKADMQGTFNLTQGDIIVEDISFLRHVHTCPACGADTSPPH
jgi:phage baseplate assembly protein V